MQIFSFAGDNYMKYQSLLSGENKKKKKKYFNMSSADNFIQHAKR